MRKINIVYLCLIILVALVLHLTILNRIVIFGSKPDLLLICVIFFGLFYGVGTGLGSGIIAGLLTDMLSATYFGINTFVFCMTGFLAGVLSSKFFRDSKGTQVMLVLVLAIFSKALYYFLSVYFFLKHPAILWVDYVITSVIPPSIYTTLISIPIFSKFISWYGLRDEEDLL